MVSVSPADAANLVPEFQNRETANAAWGRLQSMVAHDEATLLAWPVLWLLTGQHEYAQDVEEVRYPTEFDPPQFPMIFARPPLIFPTWGPKSVTAFETRHVGPEIEASATLEADGKSVVLDLHAQLVRLLGMREQHTQRSDLGIAGVVQQPDFQNSNVTVLLRVRPGQPALMGVFVISRPKPQVQLFVLHARTAPPLPNAAPISKP
jgi:hypothetical protein